MSAMTVTAPPTILTNQPIRTWFKIGGGADRFAKPTSAEELRQLVETDPDLRVLGDGANLLVDDGGVGELVVELSAPEWAAWTMDARSGLVRVGAGANLPKLILAAVRAGLGGIEVLGGIPATVGGALVMNAGGAFGQIAEVVERVRALRRDGTPVELERKDIAFGYRSSGLSDLILTGADLRLTPTDGGPLRDRLKEIMEYKKRSQPMAADSAGCCFKNPTLAADVDGIGPRGQRVSAGMVIDRAGLKGLRVGGAEVSPVHANFLVTAAGAKARDVIDLMGEVTRRVHDRFGIQLHPEVVVWMRKR